MTKHGKKYTESRKKIVSGQALTSAQALGKVKELSYAGFDESVDVAVNVGIDASKGEQVVRGSVTLPYSKGAAPRVVVFAKGDAVDEAQKAGADYIGAEDLVEKINGGWMDFEFAVATPEMMSMVGKVAKVLGPRGLLPNKKLGTVTTDVRGVVLDLKKGRSFFKNDKQGIVHFSIGKVSFDGAKLQENFVSFMKALLAAKPTTSKGKFIKKITVTSTMGPGIQVDPDEVVRA